MSYQLKLWNWNPQRELTRFNRGFDRFFDDMLTEVPEARPIPANVVEKDNHYIVTLDVPGIPKSDLKIEVYDNVLTVSGERKSEWQEEKDGVSARSSHYGQFSRSFQLPEGMDPDRIEAVHKDGVLRIAIPKAEEVKPRQISVKDAENSNLFGKLFSVKQEKSAH